MRKTQNPDRGTETDGTPNGANTRQGMRKTQNPDRGTETFVGIVSLCPVPRWRAKPKIPIAGLKPIFVNHADT